ncbi:Hypothetical_protein [Hexamita inflata]|uniref:Hypothetical_protein n=1 Tax=Hexamita inflata TaxID=28002 RepID=A0AA86RQT1_9EUKA|nr:Hypothetical protein HINF_LOCUS66641 [Hexamita inflata]
MHESTIIPVSVQNSQSNSLITILEFDITLLIILSIDILLISLIVFEVNLLSGYIERILGTTALPTYKISFILCLIELYVYCKLSNDYYCARAKTKKAADDTDSLNIPQYVGYVVSPKVYSFSRKVANILDELLFIFTPFIYSESFGANQLFPIQFSGKYMFNLFIHYSSQNDKLKQSLSAVNFRAGIVFVFGWTVVQLAGSYKQRTYSRLLSSNPVHRNVLLYLMLVVVLVQIMFNMDQLISKHTFYSCFPTF